MISAEPFTPEDFDRDGLSAPEQGICYSPAVKAPSRRSLTIRSELMSLPAFLDLCSDVKAVEAFPLAIRWKEGAREGVFYPDLRIVGTHGKNRIVHIATDDEEAEFALRLVKDHGVAMTVVTSGFLGSVQVSNCEEICRWRRIGMFRDPNEIYLTVPSTLGETALAAGMSVAAATEFLLTRGFDKEEGVQGGTPEARTATQIQAAIADGILGFDYRRPFKESSVGLPKLGRDTCKFWPLVKRFTIA